jgi:hypothetical protein
VSDVLPVDQALIARFRGAGGAIAWRTESAPGTGIRLARLDDEEARVESRSGGHELLVESGPVGALVLLLEVDRRGELPRLSSIEGGAETGFPSGAIRARWAPEVAEETGGPTWRELVRLARFALR